MRKEPLEWAEKYRPKKLADVMGHGSIIKEIARWAHAWEHGIPEHRALIFYGKPGTGKTSAAFALSQEMDWDVIELNASDQRTAGVIQKVAGSASKMGTFDGISGKRLIILDEADNLHGNYDRGGARAIIQVVRETSQPIILIANEFYDMDSALRLACRPVQFKPVDTASIAAVLKNICQSEGVAVGIGVIQQIADGADGDLRSAINDLQAAAIGKHNIEISDIATASRDVRQTVFQTMDKIFLASDIRSAQEAVWQVDESPEDFIKWVDENLPVGYKKPQDLAAGYFQLSRADQFLGRVRRRQAYKFWRYASFLMSSGVAAVKTRTYSGYMKYQSPQYLRRLGQTRTKRRIRDSIAGKIGEHCHVSKSYARSDLLTVFKQLMKHDEHPEELSAVLDMNPDEIAFLLDEKPAAKLVKKIYESSVGLVQKEVENDIEVFGGFGMTQPDEVIIDEIDEDAAEEDPAGKDSEKSVAEKQQRSLFDFED